MRALKSAVASPSMERTGCIVPDLRTAGRAGAWKRLFPRVRQSLYQGDVVLYHCMAGRHRGAAAGVVTVAVMGRMSIREAEESILKRRPIQLRQAFRDEYLVDIGHTRRSGARHCLPPCQRQWLGQPPRSPTCTSSPTTRVTCRPCVRISKGRVALGS